MSLHPFGLPVLSPLIHMISLSNHSVLLALYSFSSMLNCRSPSSRVSLKWYIIGLSLSSLTSRNVPSFYPRLVSPSRQHKLPYQIWYSWAHKRHSEGGNSPWFKLYFGCFKYYIISNNTIFFRIWLQALACLSHFLAIKAYNFRWCYEWLRFLTCLIVNN